MASTTSQSVATRVLDLMESTGVSKKTLAEETGIPRTTLVRRLTGNSPFTLAELDLLASRLGTTVGDLVNEPAA